LRSDTIDLWKNNLYNSKNYNGYEQETIYAEQNAIIDAKNNPINISSTIS
jgi:hypothetical protein